MPSVGNGFEEALCPAVGIEAKLPSGWTVVVFDIKAQLKSRRLLMAVVLAGGMDGEGRERVKNKKVLWREQAWPRVKQTVVAGVGRRGSRH